MHAQFFIYIHEKKNKEKQKEKKSNFLILFGFSLFPDGSI